MTCLLELFFDMEMRAESASSSVFLADDKLDEACDEAAAIEKGLLLPDER